jgi:2-polyprenyl-3-methyl-5-hydroxy-6-metoxy-1,4-benzoquinol methylase
MLKKLKTKLQTKPGLRKRQETRHTREKQYDHAVELMNQQGLTEMGIMSSHTWYKDPKRLLFVLSRYKFVAKMLSGMNKVLEIGCADAFGTRLVQQEIKEVTAIDFDPIFVDDVNKRMSDDKWKFNCKVHDILSDPVKVREGFDAAYAIDVIEHIKKDDEHRFLSNIVNSLNEKGVLIIGTPSLQSQIYASVESKEGHVNCKDAPELKKLMQEYFEHVFIFSMNDEVVHTGFYSMANYLFALCCSKKHTG